MPKKLTVQCRLSEVSHKHHSKGLSRIVVDGEEVDLAPDEAVRLCVEEPFYIKMENN